MKSNFTDLCQELNITSICCDSRAVKQNDVFIAIKGTGYDGNQFIDEAITNGAKIIFTDDQTITNDRALIIHVPNARIIVAEIASILYPKLPKYLIAATGTNGKTSVISYCEQLLCLLGARCASIGTLGLHSSVNIQALSGNISQLTTPDSVTLRKILHNLAENNVTHIAFEASSQGLIQERLHNIKIIAGAFTSFSHDHLDYHHSMDKYLTAKLKLFTDNLLPNGLAVINSAIPECVYIKNFLQQNGIAFLTIGHHKADININILEQSIYSQKINFSYLDKNYDFTTSIIGNFQVTNILIAALLVQKIGYDFEAIIRLLPQINAPTGRLERVTDINHRFHVFVDYAHSADALSNSLMTLRNIIPKQGKLKVVFGCGGDRDKDKRLIMGQIAYRIADEVIITDDNPRSEDPAQIRLDILAGAPLAREIGNREEAIIKSINNLQIGDILLIAGKGHENYQIIGDKRIEFSDIKISKKQL